jgi:ribosomal protein S18 acetylase RimI-like enzyme
VDPASQDGAVPVDPFLDAGVAGRRAVLAGSHRREVSPQESGRWGPSVVFRPSGAVAATLADLTTEAASIAGTEHWRSGAGGRAHVTVRALAPYVESIPAEEAARSTEALRSTAAEIGPVSFEFDGLGLSDGGVLVRAVPVDDRADELRRRLGAHLGADGWLEDLVFSSGRDPMWYCSLLHFAGPIADPNGLVAWVGGLDGHCIGRDEVTTLELCSWRWDGQGMFPVVAASVPLRDFDHQRLRERIATGAAALDVRPLTSEDLPSISWSGSATHLRNVAAQLERVASGEVEYLAVYVEGHPVCKGGVDFAKEAGAGTIWQVATHDGLQGLGLATRLIGALEDHVDKRGLATVRLAVEPDNRRALRLYEHLGYRGIGTSEAAWEAERPDGTRFLYTTTLVEMSKAI